MKYPKTISWWVVIFYLGSLVFETPVCFGKPDPRLGFQPLPQAEQAVSSQTVPVQNETPKTPETSLEFLTETPISESSLAPSSSVSEEGEGEEGAGPGENTKGLSGYQPYVIPEQAGIQSFESWMPGQARHDEPATSANRIGSKDETTAEPESDHVLGELLIRAEESARGFFERAADFFKAAGNAAAEGLKALQDLPGSLANLFLDLGVRVVEKLFDSFSDKSHETMSDAEKSLDNLYTLYFDETKTPIEEAIEKLQVTGQLAYAEKNSIFKLDDSEIQSDRDGVGLFSQPSSSPSSSDPQLEDLLNYDLSNLWGLEKINVKDAWKQFDLNGNGKFDAGETRPGEGVTVAVIDTGIYYNHPDLFDNVWVNAQEISHAVGDRNHDNQITWQDADFNGDGRVSLRDLDGLTKDASGNAIWYQASRDGVVSQQELDCVIDGIDSDENNLRDDILGWNFNLGNGQILDGNAHGTHVSGTVAANGTILGVAPWAHVMPVKVLNDYGWGQFDDIIKGIYYSVSQNAAVINMSLGGQASKWSEEFRLMNDAVNYAYEKGTTVVVAAGNGDAFGYGIDAKTVSPANTDHAVTVSAIQSYQDASQLGDLTRFSNFGWDVEIAAPGNRILSSTPYGYDYFRGTSMASPHVAGAAALVASHLSGVGPDEVLQALQQGSAPLESVKYAGSGILNAAQALHVTPSLTARADLQLTRDMDLISGQAFQAGQTFEVPVHVEGKKYRLEYALGTSPEYFTQPKEPVFLLTDDWKLVQEGDVTQADFTIPVDLTAFHYPEGTHSTLRLTVWDDQGRTYEDRDYFYLTDVTPPIGSMTVNHGDAVTDSRKVTVQLNVTDSESSLKDMSFFDGQTWGRWEPFQTEKQITLPAWNTVKVKVRDQYDNESVLTDSIEYRVTQSFAFQPGWNLISFFVGNPMTFAEFRSQNQLSGEIKFAAAETGNPENRSFILNEQMTIQIHAPIWVLNESGTSVTARRSGEPYELTSKRLVAGTDLIGGLKGPVSKDELFVNGMPFQGKIWKWDAAGQAFVETGILEAGQGYKLETVSAGILNYRVNQYNFPLVKGYQIRVLSDHQIQILNTSNQVKWQGTGRILMSEVPEAFSIRLNPLGELDAIEYSSLADDGLSFTRYEYRINFETTGQPPHAAVVSYEGCQRDLETYACINKTLLDVDESRGLLRQYNQTGKYDRASIFYDFQTDVGFRFIKKGRWSPWEWTPQFQKDPFLQIHYTRSYSEHLDLSANGYQIFQVIHHANTGKYILLRAGEKLDLNEAAAFSLSKSTAALRGALTDDLLINLNQPISASTSDLTFRFSEETSSTSTVESLRGIQAEEGGKLLAVHLSTRHSADGKILVDVPGLSGEVRIYEVTVREDEQLYLNLLETKEPEIQVTLQMDQDLKIRKFQDGSFAIAYKGAEYLSENGSVVIYQTGVTDPVRIQPNFSDQGMLQSFRMSWDDLTRGELLVTFEQDENSGSYRVKKIINLFDSSIGIPDRASFVMDLDYQKMQILTSWQYEAGAPTQTAQQLDIFADRESMLANGICLDARDGIKIVDFRHAFLQAYYSDGKLLEIIHQRLKGPGLPVDSADSYDTFLYIPFGEFDFDPFQIDWGKSSDRTTEKLRSYLKDDLLLKEVGWPYFALKVEPTTVQGGHIFKDAEGLSFFDGRKIYVGLDWWDAAGNYQDGAQSILEYDDQGQLVLSLKGMRDGDRLIFDVEVDSEKPQLTLRLREWIKKSATVWTDMRIPGNPLLFDRMENGTYELEFLGRHYASDQTGLFKLPNRFRAKLYQDTSGNIEYLDVWKEREGNLSNTWIFRYHFETGPSSVITNRGDILNLVRVEARNQGCPDCAFQPYLEISHIPPLLKQYSLTRPSDWTMTLFSTSYAGIIQWDQTSGAPKMDPLFVRDKPLLIAEGSGEVIKKATLHLESFSSDTPLQGGDYEIVQRGKILDLDWETLRQAYQKNTYRLSPNLILNQLVDDALVRVADSNGNFISQSTQTADGLTFQVQGAATQGISFRVIFPDQSRQNQIQTFQDDQGNFFLKVPFPDGSEKRYSVIVDDVGTVIVVTGEEVAAQFRIKLDHGMTLQTLKDGSHRMIYKGKVYDLAQDGTFEIVTTQNLKFRCDFDASGNPRSLWLLKTQGSLTQHYEMLLEPDPDTGATWIPSEIREWQSWQGGAPTLMSQWVYDYHAGLVRQFQAGAEVGIWIPESRRSLGRNFPAVIDHLGLTPSMQSYGYAKVFLYLQLSQGEVVNFGGETLSAYWILRKPGVQLENKLDWSQMEYRNIDALKVFAGEHTLIHAERTTPLNLAANDPNITAYFAPPESGLSRVLDEIKIDVSIKENYVWKYLGQYSLVITRDGALHLFIPELQREYEGKLTETGEISLPIMREGIRGRVNFVFSGDDLQAVMNAAQAGDEIRVYPGEYHGHFILKEGINLIGCGAANQIMLHGDFKTGTNVLTTQGQNRIEGITITGGGAYAGASSSAIKVEGANVTVRGCQIKDNKSYGIYVTTEGAVTIENNVFSGNGVGVQLPKNGTVIRNNQFYRNSIGVNVLGSTAPLIEGNNFKLNTFASIYEFAWGKKPTRGYAVVRNNTFFMNTETPSAYGPALPPAVERQTDGNKVLPVTKPKLDRPHLKSGLETAQ